jgi:signal transduction histidine kinase
MRKGNVIVIEIEDHGVGIPESEIEKIYKPFIRATNAKFIGGFGIGLSIVAKIMELHNANMKVASTLNKGTCFMLRFKRQLD